MMKLRLTALAPTTRGIYNTRAGPDTLPERFRYLHPDAAAGFVALEAATGGLVYSDILRSAEESLHAAQTKRGVQPPGFSGHNFGFSVDVAVEETMKLRGWDYAKLVATMEAYGWHCHRRDGARGYRLSEHWHFNFFGAASAKYLKTTIGGSWASPLEALVLDTYEEAFRLTDAELQACLKKLGMYAGDVDGQVGPLTRAAVGAFQRAWMMDGQRDEVRTRRVLAFVAAEREIV
jgi:hypothetical protein